MTDSDRLAALELRVAALELLLAKDAPKRGGKFVPPTAEEAEAEFDNRGYGGKALGQAFVAHYAARNWRYNGNVLMKDWKAAITTWCLKQGPPAVKLQMVNGNGHKPVEPTSWSKEGMSAVQVSSPQGRKRALIEGALKLNPGSELPPEWENLVQTSTLPQILEKLHGIT